MSKQAILFLHGMASSGRSTTAEYLRERFRAIPQIDFHTIDFNPTPILIIHGRQDTAVPLDHSRTYAANFPEQVRLIEVDADHDLNGHLELIWDHVQSYLLPSTARR